MVEITLSDEAIQPKADLEFTLPNGVKVEMWEPTGETLEKAMRAIPKKAGPSATTYALIAQSCRFDGQRLRYEDIRKMKMRVLTELMRKFNEVNGNMVPLSETKAEEKEESSE
jgi:hypothetical protein